MEDQAQELKKMMSNNKKTRIIAITSGKGGVGKSNLSVNMAIAYAQQGKKVTLIDGDLGMANVNVLMNVVPQYNLMHVINKQKTMQEIINETEFGIKFIAGANGFSKIANLTVDELDYFAKQFAMLGNSDIIIIDTGAGIANNVLQFVAAADEVYVVTTPEPTAITDAYGIIKIITTELVDREMNIKLLVNRVHSADEGKRISDRIINIAGQFLNKKVDYIGFVYDDPVVQASVIRQKPFIIVNPTSKPAQCIKHIVGRIEKSDIGSSEGVSSFLKKFLRKN
ncbi:MinD/ParA family protein [Treponema ruminis]|uniref:Flagellar biosynthesis protein FlhG n=1 Tax=Treponema ruminis TaxID=744515 RepID=A0A7W8G8G7_9SPIR|nr:MinD/ParA family protein [Treponema ruminis]MBB5225746.1 flagellar biosynthesis protein FlhG [Treponema ruminis]QSI02436.1 MinD/ParA family protein [Treponema ruminis]